MAKKTNTTINDKNYYRITATIGIDSEGKRIRRQFYGASKKDAENKRDEYLNGIKRGLNLDFDKITVGELFKVWFEDVMRPSVKLSSYNRYSSDYNLRIKDSRIATMRITDLKPIHFQSWYSQLAKDYSYNTMINTNKVMNKFLNYCVKQEYIIKNPITLIEFPAPPDNLIMSDSDAIVTLDKHEIEAVKHSDFIFIFALMTGLRRGEILALTHDDISEKDIHVTKTLGANGEITTPKTKTSIRSVPIANDLQPLIKQHIISEKEKHLKRGVPFSTSNFLFSSNVCTYILPRNLNRRWATFASKNNINKPFKTLRASFCTLLCERGVDIKTASVIIGHSTIKTTEKFYAAVKQDKKHEAISVLDGFI